MAAAAHPAIYLLMGVSGCGKSSVGHRLAAALNVPYVEADEFHPPENVARMAAGRPLTDADRQGWLLELRDRLAHSLAQGRGAVLGCSALKRSYRDILRTGAPQLRLVHLHGSRALLAARLAARRDHYMPASLLDSQLATLQVPEPEEDALRVDISQDVDTIVTIILATGTPAHD